jgi:hypothetical protein
VGVTTGVLSAASPGVLTAVTEAAGALVLVEVAALTKPTALTINPSDKALIKNVFLMFKMKNHPSILNSWLRLWFKSVTSLNLQFCKTLSYFSLVIR